MSEPHNYSEKRNFSRMTMQCFMTYSFPDTDEAREGIAIDLSSSGLLFACEQALKPGMKLEINVTPDNSLIPPLNAMVEVARIVDTGKGIYEVGVKLP